jgi:hypothetical protein
MGRTSGRFGYFIKPRNEATHVDSHGRKWAFDKNRDPWVRFYSIAILGMDGDSSDFEILESSYSLASSELEKAQIVAALAKMERGRRNSFYGRVMKDGDLVRRTIEFVKQTT